MKPITKIWTRAVRACGIWACAILFGFFGCAGPVADPGPRPARVQVEVKARVSKEQVRETLNRWGPPAAAQVRFSSFFGPYWTLSAHLIQENGSLSRVESEPGKEFPRAVGHRVAAQAVYLLPPGPCRLRLELCAQVKQQWQESFGPPFPRRVKGRLENDRGARWRERSREGEVACFKRVIKLDLRPGELLVLRPFEHAGD